MSNNKKNNGIAYIYTRVSTEAQNVTNDNNSSLETQATVCKDFAKNNNLTVNGVYEEVCSGRISDNQKELLKVFNKIKKQSSDTRIYLLTADVTRFSRDVTGISKIFENCSLKDHDIVIHSVRDNVSYTTYDKKNHNNTEFINKLLDSQKEWDKISQRAKQAYQARKARGHTFTRIPYGKMRSTSGYKNNIVEKKIIKQILELKNQGYSRIDIVKYLHDNDIMKRGKMFTLSAVNIIIKNNDMLSMNKMKQSLNSL